MSQPATTRLVTWAELAARLAPMQTAITALQTAITAQGNPSTFPYPFYATGSAYAGRPVTSRPVWWMSWDVAPPSTTGTTTSGTGPVPDLDFVFLAPGVVAG